MLICRLHLSQGLVCVFPTWQHQIKKIFRRKQTCWDVPIKENRVKPAVDSKKDRRADKFPLIRAPAAFSFPKQQDNSTPSPCRRLGRSHRELSSGRGWTLDTSSHRRAMSYPFLPCLLPSPNAQLSRGALLTHSGFAVMFSITARSKTSKDSREEKPVNRSTQGGKPTCRYSSKQNTLKLPRLQGRGDAVGREAKLLK